MSSEELVIDNLIYEAKFFVDHQDENETYLQLSQECIDKINGFLKKNVRYIILNIKEMHTYH